MGRQQLKISIVTPCLNQQTFLQRTIESVVGQCYPNLEYIIVDGGSTDGTCEIIEKHKQHLSCWISEPDDGQYHALNKGFAKSSGQIMAWLNADDIYMPYTLRVVSQIFSSFPNVDWITSLLPAIVNHEDAIISIKPRRGFTRSLFMQGLLMTTGKTGEHGFIQQESTFWRRSLWAKAGGRLDTRYGLAADFALWGKFFRFSNLYGVNAVLSGFRLHGDQRSVQHQQPYRAEALQALAEGGGSTPRGLRAFIYRCGLPGHWPLRVMPRMGFVSIAPLIWYDSFEGKWRLDQRVVR